MRIRCFPLVAALSLSGGLLQSQTSGGMPANHAGMPMQPASGALTALLTDPLGSRSASGTATVNGTTVRMTWVGDMPGAMRTWSVRRGSCARDEGLVGAASAYAPITVDTSGRASTSATLDAPLADGGQFHVRVQGSAGSTTALACGSIANVSAPAHAAAAAPVPSPHSSKAATKGEVMDHSTMDHSAMNMSEMTLPGKPGSDSGLMAIHRRMMADPVIRERVMTDPILQRMMAAIPGMSAMSMEMPEMVSTEMSKMPGTARTDDPMKRPSTPAGKAVPKPVAKPVAKPSAKPTPAAMPGMDHSKMPGMRKPPA